MEVETMEAIKLAIQGRLAEVLPPALFYVYVAPVLIMFLGSLVALLAGVFRSDPDEPSITSFGIALATVSFAGIAPLLTPVQTPVAYLGSGVLIDKISQLSFIVIALGTLFTLVAASLSSRGRSLLKPELVTLILLCSSGMMVLASAGEFLSFFVGLEIMSISLYVLVGYQRQDLHGLEAAVKYFITGAAAAATLLMGMAFVYMHTGSLKWADFLHLDLSSSTYPFALLGYVLMFCGLGFKIALAPFHSWAADVYQGAHSLLTGYMLTLVKFAVGVVILRILSVGVAYSAPELVGFFWILGVLSIAIGSFFGLVHNSVKRMLAYSSIANAGYFCLAFAALAANPANQAAKDAFLGYAVIYVIMNLGVFAALAWAEEGTHEDLLKEELAGLGERNPFAATSLTIFLFGLAGIPPLAGFFGKLLLIQAAVGEGLIGLAIIFVLFSCISLFYYLSLMVQMWFKPATRTSANPDNTYARGWKVLIGICALLTLYIGIKGPWWAFNFDAKSAVEKKMVTK